MTLGYDEQNIFARILRGEVSSYQIFEDDHTVAILDAFPICPGHALLLPKAPCVSMLDMPAEVASCYLASLPKLASIVQRATGAPGVKIVQNSGAEAGQIVFHCHFHVVPRFGGSGETMASSGPLKPEDAADMLRRMRGLSAPPFSRVLAALDNLVGEMQRGDVHPAAAVKSVGVKPAGAAAPPKPAKPLPSPAEPKPDAGPGPPRGAAPPSGGPPTALAGEQGDKKASKKAAQDKAAAKAAAAGGGAAAKGGGDADADRPVDVSWLDIRVGHITAAEAHPDSDKLYVETIEVGEPSPRQVLSGLAQHMHIDAVRGARVLVLCNLGAKKMGGVESQGMVLCAKGGGGLEFVVPPAGSAPGTRVSVDGYSGDPELNPKRVAKKKAWEACMPELATDAGGVACYKGVPLRTPEGVCAAKGVVNAPIS